MEAIVQRRTGGPGRCVKQNSDLCCFLVMTNHRMMRKVVNHLCHVSCLVALINDLDNFFLKLISNDGIVLFENRWILFQSLQKAAQPSMTEVIVVW